mgnify:CR=1 FL=1
MKLEKSTLLADDTRGLINTKQTKPRPVASAAPHPTTSAYVNAENIYIEIDRRLYLAEAVHYTINIVYLGLPYDPKKTVKLDIYREFIEKFNLFLGP